MKFYVQCGGYQLVTNQSDVSDALILFVKRVLYYQVVPNYPFIHISEQGFSIHAEDLFFSSAEIINQIQEE